MNIMEALAFQQLQQQAVALAAQVEQLALEQAALAGRLNKIEAAACAITARRAADATRQQRRRSRDALAGPVARDCSPEMP